MAGFISGLDGDTPETIREMAKQLDEIGVDVPFLSVLTPFRGTPDYKRYQDDGRLLEDRGWEFYNGYNVTFEPRLMTPEELLEAHRARSLLGPPRWDDCTRNVATTIWSLVDVNHDEQLLRPESSPTQSTN